MDYDYSIDYLIEKLEEHGRKYIEENSRLIKKFIECNPEIPLPTHYQDDFNLPYALQTFAKEIKQIKAELENLKCKG